MKGIVRATAIMFGTLVLAGLMAVNAGAQCGASDGPLTSNTATALLMHSAPTKATTTTTSAPAPSAQVAPVGAPIVGFWHVKFISKGTGFIPDGTVVDMGFSQWHSDGTEILNSSRPPATSNFCLGVWEKTGNHTYKLNHFAPSSDLNGNLIGPANIREDVTLDASGNSYTGKFTIDLFDLNGNTLAHVAGNISATRITVDTTIGDIL